MNHLTQINEHDSTPKNVFNIIDDEDVQIYMHNFYKFFFNGDLGAPVHEKLQKSAKVLAFRECGIWTAEVAAEYPNSEFYAVDSIILDSRNEFNNITFIECDDFKKIPFPDNEFDYVFTRDNFLYLEKTTLQEGLSELFRVLRPGGWLEVINSRQTDLAPGLMYTGLVNAWRSYLETQNIDSDILNNFENYLHETGKIDYMSYRIIKPQAKNASEEVFIDFFLMFFRNARDVLASFMNISFEEYDVLMNNIEKELEAKGNRMTLLHKKVLARKKYTHSKETEITIPDLSTK
ncbi:6229_t:CDS:2 [Cetraspora pellucida]|uniref:6229_t:CDS:1 n=1 Tax=Cetraspora pellucida TaxID=1433469 RepID=A0A9N9GU17_9GLOM|nr:6229_t:CDS:2 [Cetraspora pellucida]